ncbi:MerR family transcriptional regulator [Paenibacillus sp. GCM10012303]|jgi:hypothetical protein|uniref:MerR family transcriptional regulator n=1 Tax=Paenibacillus sp. GCM10012303 TaxID=3317340 RepID=UPI00361657C1
MNDNKARHYSIGEFAEKTGTSVRTLIALLEEKGDIDSSIMMTLIHSIQTENEQREWLEGHTSKEIANRLFDQPDDRKLELDKEYLELSGEVKRLFGRPAGVPEVQGLVERYMKASLEFVGEEAMNGFGSLESVQLEDLENMVVSPFSKEEEDWLNEAMELFMIRNGMIDPIP